MKFTIEEFLLKLPLPKNEKWKEGVWDVEAFRKKRISLVFFAPKEKDYQTFHDEDEFYFIVRGTGELIIDNEKFSCIVGDAFFVAANVKHHFENFTEDFAAWAIFF
ncbi:MAG: cupin domain-containing protein [Acidobacteriota bacterium]|nr:cupin domain-containing protein [Acidobacteriota bacterium]